MTAEKDVQVARKKGRGGGGGNLGNARKKTFISKWGLPLERHRVGLGCVWGYLSCRTFILFFQHPFIRDACDRKPLLDLLAEFKAEIINEEEMDIEEEVRKGSISHTRKYLINSPWLPFSPQRTYHRRYILSKTNHIIFWDRLKERYYKNVYITCYNQ